jgi:UPF0755 protein
MSIKSTVKVVSTLVLLTLSLGIGFGGALWWLNGQFFRPYKSGEQPPTAFIVERGWGVSTVADELAKRGITRNAWALKILAKLKKEKLKEIHSGEYSLSAGMSVKEILQKFIDQEIVYHSLTIPEGANLELVRTLMEKTTIVSASEVERALRDRNLLNTLGIQSSSFEGYLFPETYRFSRPDTAEAMITRMVKEGEKRKTPEMVERARLLGFTWHQLLTLASMIEKESGNNDPEERRKISSVFHNRLRLKMLLQSDPTVIYGIPNFNGNLTKADLQTPTPYNTYLNEGLPPTPICNPGVEAIKAALEPADTDYLYFVAKGDGSSFFSKDYQTHQAAVKKFQLQVKSDVLDSILGE